MKIIEISRAGLPETLVIKEVKTPDTKPSELKIRVHASGVNFADVLARQGLYQNAPPFPFVIGYEASGIVEEVGAHVDRSWIGKEAVALTHFAGYADTVFVPESRVFEKPKNLTFEEAAAFPVNALTAWGLLVNMGSLKKGETILIHNAGGGVGLAAIDIARHLGARTIGTSSPGKHEKLKAHGLDIAIDYRQPNWDKEILTATDGKGVDLVIDPLGPDSWKKSSKLLKHFGRLGIYGVSEVSSNGPFRQLGMIKELLKMPFYHPIPLLTQSRGVFALNMAHFWDNPDCKSDWVRDVIKGVEAGWIHPHVDKVFPFEKASEAHRYLEERRNFGKVILKHKV